MLHDKHPVRKNMSSSRKSSRRRLISSSDEDSGPSTRKSIQRLSAEKKRRVKLSLGSDSESENDENTAVQAQTGSRSSERLHKRYSRSFRMPSRDSIWKDIPTTPTSADKAIGRLKPLKNVHNLSRITHRYNQDCYNSDDEGESETDNFVVPDGDVSEDNVSSDGEDESDVEKNKHGQEHRSTGRHHRVRGYHNKICNPASSSSDSEGTTSGVRNRNRETRSHLDDKESEAHDDNHSDISESSGQSKQPGECESRSQKDRDDDEFQIRSSSHRSKRRRSRIQSSSDSDQSPEPSAKGKQLFAESEIKSDNTSKCSVASDVALSSQQSATATPTCSKKTRDESRPNHGSVPKDTGVNLSEISDSESEIHSDSDSNSINTSDSGSSGSDSGHDGHFDLDNIKSSRARHQIQKQESEKKKKFEAFLEARRKLSGSKKK